MKVMEAKGGPAFDLKQSRQLCRVDVHVYRNFRRTLVENELVGLEDALQKQATWDVVSHLGWWILVKACNLGWI